MNDNPFDIAASAKSHTFDTVNIKNFASEKKKGENLSGNKV